MGGLKSGAEDLRLGNQWVMSGPVLLGADSVDLGREILAAKAVKPPLR